MLITVGFRCIRNLKLHYNLSERRTNRGTDSYFCSNRFLTWLGQTLLIPLSLSSSLFFHLSHPFFKKSCDKYFLKTQCFTQCRDKQQYQCRWWKQDLESHQSWSNWWDLTFKKRMNINKKFHNFLPIQPINVLQHDFYFWI